MSKREQESAATGPSVAGRKGSKSKQVEPPVFEPNAGGCDVGAREIYVGVPADRDEHPVRRCGTFTSELHEMAEWLVRCGVTTVAMESTGVYWIPVYDVFEQHGITGCLVNPRNMKNVPGKRTDFHECQWIQYLHSMGLLHAAFRPESEVRAVRSLMRHRNDLVDMASQHDQLRGDKAFELVQISTSNKDWRNEDRRNAIWFVGLLARRMVDHQATYEWLFEQMRSNPDLDMRRTAAGVVGSLLLQPKRIQAVEDYLATEEKDATIIKNLRAAVKKAKEADKK